MWSGSRESGRVENDSAKILGPLFIPFKNKTAKQSNALQETSTCGGAFSEFWTCQMVVLSLIWLKHKTSIYYLEAWKCSGKTTSSKCQQKKMHLKERHHCIYHCIFPKTRQQSIPTTMKNTTKQTANNVNNYIYNTIYILLYIIYIYIYKCSRNMMEHGVACVKSMISMIRCLPGLLSRTLV